jgi:dihydroorotase
VGWTPLDGVTLPGRIAATWVNGELAWDGATVQPKPLGQRMRFA